MIVSSTTQTIGHAAAAARRIRDQVDTLPLADPAALLEELGRLVSVLMGGSSGVLISIMLTAAGSAMADGSPAIEALARGLDAMRRYGGARPGDRTMLDALSPAIGALRDGGSLQQAAKAARQGADATARMDAAASGRSAYVPSEHLLGVPDRGRGNQRDPRRYGRRMTPRQAGARQR